MSTRTSTKNREGVGHAYCLVRPPRPPHAAASEGARARTPSVPPAPAVPPRSCLGLGPLLGAILRPTPCSASIG